MKLIQRGDLFYWVPYEMLDDAEQIGASAIIKEVLCIDTTYTTTNGRYGMFTARGTGGWKSIPPDEFPNEFKTQVLLLT